MAQRSGEAEARLRAGHSDRLSPFPENHDSDCDIRLFTVQLTVLRYTAGSSVLHSWVRVRDHSAWLGPWPWAHRARHSARRESQELTRVVLPTSALFYPSCVNGQDKRIPSLGNAQAAAAAS